MVHHMYLKTVKSNQDLTHKQGVNLDVEIGASLALSFLFLSRDLMFLFLC